jgi:hypothetical protein
MIRAAACATLLALTAAAPAWADADLFSRQTVSGLIDLRLAAADGEKSFTDGGYGKGRYSGAGDSYRITPQVAEAALVWKPRFTWDISGVVQLDVQPDQNHLVDVTEAYLAYKPAPRSDWSYSARAGYFYPPISQEHGDPAWGVTHTITPSAINSWVGEEVKVLGFEQKLTRKIAGQELSATVAGFGYNDTSGTLLSLRGWALHDIKETAFGDFPLPKLNPQYQGIWRAQAPYTVPTVNLTGRIGYYGRVDWRTSGPVAFNLFYYNNAGNRTAVVDLQWSWETKFWNAGASWDVDEHTQILAQAMKGSTYEGYPTPVGIWIDVDFASAYLLATHSFGKSALTGRVDWFDTVDNTYVKRDNNNEHGWAYTGAWRYDFNPKLTVLIEAMHVTSGRFARQYISVAPRQDQTTFQTSLRLRL